MGCIKVMNFILNGRDISTTGMQNNQKSKTFKLKIALLIKSKRIKLSTYMEFRHSQLILQLIPKCPQVQSFDCKRTSESNFRIKQSH